MKTIEIQLHFYRFKNALEQSNCIKWVCYEIFYNGYGSIRHVGVVNLQRGYMFSVNDLFLKKDIDKLEQTRYTYRRLKIPLTIVLDDQQY